MRSNHRFKKSPQWVWSGKHATAVFLEKLKSEASMQCPGPVSLHKVAVKATIKKAKPTDIMSKTSTATSHKASYRPKHPVCRTHTNHIQEFTYLRKRNVLNFHMPHWQHNNNNKIIGDEKLTAAIQTRSTHTKWCLGTSFSYCQAAQIGSTLLFPPASVVPISFHSKQSELRATLQWLCFGQIEALEAGSTSLFSTVDWTASALWSLVRDSRRNSGLHTIMSAIFHSWVSWYCGMTAATTLQPW